MRKYKVKYLISFIFIFTSLNAAEVIDEKYCSYLRDEIKNGIGNFYAYNEQITQFSENQANLSSEDEDFEQRYSQLQKLIDSARSLAKSWEDKIHKDSITWANLCK